MAADLEFFFDPVCPFCWVTSRWVTTVGRQRPLDVIWRPLSLRILNEPIGYETRPAGYPEAHQRGLEMVRVVAAAREAYGPAVVGDLYTAMGEAVWSVPAPQEATFEAVLGETTRPRDLPAILARAGLPHTEVSARLAGSPLKCGDLRPAGPNHERADPVPDRTTQTCSVSPAQRT